MKNKTNITIKIMKAIRVFSILSMGAGTGGMLESGIAPCFITCIVLALVLCLLLSGSIKTLEQEVEYEEVIS